jgi:hypothetical protein
MTNDTNIVSVTSESMLDEEFKKERAQSVRDLAEKADPFTRRRLIELVSRYELPAVNRKKHPHYQNGGGNSR